MRPIDADELLKRVDQSWQNAGLRGVDYYKFKKWVHSMPTIEAEPNCDIKWQGRYCIECLYSSTCHGAGIDKPACKSFVPRVRYVDCIRKVGGEDGTD